MQEREVVKLGFPIPADMEVSEEKVSITTRDPRIVQVLKDVKKKVAAQTEKEIEFHAVLSLQAEHRQKRP